MKITKIGCQINLNQVMDVCFDVSKEKLNSFFEMGSSEYDDEISNNTATIGKKLKQYHEMALKGGKNTLRVICEPTGQYDRKLLRTARRLGFLTAYVNAESVAKFRIVETNDNGKTDIKDPHIMRTLGKLGKTLKHRVLDDNYLSLRKLGQIVLPLVKRGNLYGTFYHKKKEKMQYGNKVMTAVTRSFLRKFFGWYKNGGGEFKRDRFFTSYSLYRKLQENAA